jgi:hypothetical protein
MPKLQDNVSSHEERVVLLVLRDETGSVTFFVNPELRSIVKGEELTYIEDLLKDFIGRAKEHPIALFKQLSSLGVGPLVTYESGLDFTECPFLVEMLPRFVQL